MAGRDTELKEKRARFVEEYLLDLNATQAAIRAKYSEKTAYSQGQRLLRNVEIQKAIQARQKALSKKLEITQERVLREMARIAFFDFRKLWDKNGNLIDFADLDEDTAAVIAGADVEDIYEGTGKDRVYLGKLRKIRLNNKTQNLELLGKHLGLFGADNKQKGEAIAEGETRALSSIERAARIVELVRRAKLKAKAAENGRKK